MLKYKQKGFTLMEILIGIGIIGILAVVALPYYQAYQYRAKAAEVVIHLDKIKGALATLEASTGKSIGKELNVGTQPCSLHGDTGVVYWIKSGEARDGVGLPGIDVSDVMFPDLGVMMLVSSGFVKDAAGAGQYRIDLRRLSGLCLGNHPAVKPEVARQIMLAVGHIMEPHARSIKGGSGVTYGSGSVTIELSLHE